MRSHRARHPGSVGSIETGRGSVMSTIREEILSGMATILWGSAWADHAEEKRCTRLAGEKIENIMPDIPKEAREHAERIATEYEKLNGCMLGDLYQRALVADAKEETLTTPGSNGDGAERFGECLAWMVMGAGVSWFDDHAEFDLKEPYSDDAYCDLLIVADESCA